MKYCHKCLTPWDEAGAPGFRDICPRCKNSLHACLNCRFYDTSKSNQCFANVEEPVIYKDRSNFCEEFRFAEHKAPPAPPSKSAESAKDAFNTLFKKK